MTNTEITNILALMTKLLELDNGNPFRIRAYERALQTLAGITHNIADMTPGELKQIPGIGPGIQTHIREIISTGTMRELETLKAKYPKGVLEMLEIGGLGPKRVAIVFNKLKIDSPKALRSAAVSGKLSALDGFGHKLEENIIRGVDLAQTQAHRIDIWQAKIISRALLEQVKKIKNVSKVEIAGSLRRGKETVGDLDILCVSNNGGKVIKDFTKLSCVERILAAGQTKASVQLKRGIQCDLRVVPKESLGAALMYFTGSKQHNIALREHALKLGYTINEYGLFKIDTGCKMSDAGKKKKKSRKIAGKTEKEAYKALGLEWIPPELRESTGEIEAAKKHCLPKLVTLKDIRGDTHNHTVHSDGSNTIEEMIGAAIKKSWEWVLIGDHSEGLKVANGVSRDDLAESIIKIRKLNKKYADIEALRGMEVEIHKDGSLDYSDKELTEIDCVIGAVHSGFKMSQPEMTSRIERAIESGHVDMIAHLTGRKMPNREGYQINIESILKLCAQTNTALEINGQPERQDLIWQYAKRAKELGVKIALSTDAHSISQLDYMEVAVTVARRAWLEKKDILNCLSAKEIKDWLKNHKKKG
ncbi:DNA polymerase/3'-5' exonuclease PolX [Elusimicrobiota bacterium]